MAVRGVKSQLQGAAFLLPDGELCLIAVAVGSIRPDDGPQSGKMESADAFECVLNPLLFGPQFRFVGNVPVNAPPALRKLRAVHRDPVGKG